MLLRLLGLARAQEELAEAEVAVGDEGAHAARLGERRRAPEVRGGLALRGSIAARRHRAEEPQRVDFVAALLVCSGEGDGGPERCLGPVRGSIAFQAEAL